MHESLQDEVRANLRKWRGKFPQLAVLSGVKLRTIRKISCGETLDPKGSTIDKLLKTFAEHEAV